MADLSRKVLLVLTGPTAVGKTELCLQLAERLGTEIISADARQCYQGLRIGTAQPTAAQRARVRHHLVDFLPLQVRYSAGTFERDAMELLTQLWQRHRVVLLSGGTGLYIQAVCEGLWPMPQVPQALQAQLQQRYLAGGLAPLLAELAQRDPRYYAQVEKRNPHRVLRALAVCLASGKPLSSFQQQRLPKRPFRIVKVALHRQRDQLYARIEARVEAMLQQGLVEEVEALYPWRQQQALQSIGYRELFPFIAGKMNLAEAVVLLKRNTRHYAKRQLSWLRRDATLQWLPANAPGRVVEAVSRAVEER